MHEFLVSFLLTVAILSFLLGMSALLSLRRREQEPA
jgi:hypothetical protein